MNLYQVKFYDENYYQRSCKIKAEDCVTSGNKTVFYVTTIDGKKQIVWEYPTLSIMENITIDK